MKIIGTGLTGLVGSRITHLLPDVEFFNISSSTGVDITNKEQVLSAISSFDAQVVVHLAAKTHVDACEEDKKEDIRILGGKPGTLTSTFGLPAGRDTGRREEEWKEKKTAWAVNVYGTQNIVDACRKTEKKIIFVSTDFVFDGDAPPHNGYTEEDIPCAVNWYGQTKLEAEKIVQTASVPWVIMRIGYPYGVMGKKPDFVRAIKERLEKKQVVAGVVDHIMTPTYLDDIVLALNTFIRENSRGIFHVVGSQWISPYDAAIKIANIFRLDSSLITKTTREEYFKNRAPRPFQLKVNNAKISKMGVEMRTFEEGLEKIKAQL